MAWTYEVQKCLTIYRIPKQVFLDGLNSLNTKRRWKDVIKQDLRKLVLMRINTVTSRES